MRADAINSAVEDIIRKKFLMLFDNPDEKIQKTAIELYVFKRPNNAPTAPPYKVEINPEEADPFYYLLNNCPFNTAAKLIDLKLIEGSSDKGWYKNGKDGDEYEIDTDKFEMTILEENRTGYEDANAWSGGPYTFDIDRDFALDDAWLTFHFKDFYDWEIKELHRANAGQNIRKTRYEERKNNMRGIISQIRKAINNGSVRKKYLIGILKAISDKYFHLLENNSSEFKYIHPEFFSEKNTETKDFAFKNSSPQGLCKFFTDLKTVTGQGGGASEGASAKPPNPSPPGGLRTPAAATLIGAPASSSSKASANQPIQSTQAAQAAQAQAAQAAQALTSADHPPDHPLVPFQVPGAATWEKVEAKKNLETLIVGFLSKMFTFLDFDSFKKYCDSIYKWGDQDWGRTGSTGAAGHVYGRDIEMGESYLNLIHNEFNMGFDPVRRATNFGALFPLNKKYWDFNKKATAREGEYQTWEGGVRGEEGIILPIDWPPTKSTTEIKDKLFLWIKGFNIMHTRNTKFDAIYEEYLDTIPNENLLNTNTNLKGKLVHFFEESDFESGKDYKNYPKGKGSGLRKNWWSTIGISRVVEKLNEFIPDSNKMFELIKDIIGITTPDSDRKEQEIKLEHEFLQEILGLKLEEFGKVCKKNIQIDFYEEILNQLIREIDSIKISTQLGGASLDDELAKTHSKHLMPFLINTSLEAKTDKSLTKKIFQTYIDTLLKETRNGLCIIGRETQNIFTYHEFFNMYDKLDLTKTTDVFKQSENLLEKKFEDPKNDEDIYGNYRLARFNKTLAAKLFTNIVDLFEFHTKLIKSLEFVDEENLDIQGFNMGFCKHIKANEFEKYEQSFKKNSDPILKTKLYDNLKKYSSFPEVKTMADGDCAFKAYYCFIKAKHMDDDEDKLLDLSTPPLLRNIYTNPWEPLVYEAAVQDNEKDKELADGIASADGLVDKLKAQGLDADAKEVERLKKDEATKNAAALENKLKKEGLGSWSYFKAMRDALADPDTTGADIEAWATEAHALAAQLKLDGKEDLANQVEALAKDLDAAAQAKLQADSKEHDKAVTDAAGEASK